MNRSTREKLVRSLKSSPTFSIFLSWRFIVVLFDLVCFCYHPLKSLPSLMGKLTGVFHTLGEWVRELSLTWTFTFQLNCILMITTQPETHHRMFHIMPDHSIDFCEMTGWQKHSALRLLLIIITVLLYVLWKKYKHSTHTRMKNF